MVVLLIIGAFQAFFFAVISLTRNALRANYILSSWLFVISLHLLINYFEGTGMYQRIPRLMGLSSSFFFLYGPFLYLYVKEFTGGSPRHWWLHFGPFLVYNLMMIRFYAMDNYEEKTAFISSQQSFVYALSFLKFGLLAVYVVLGLFAIVHYEKRIRNLYSDASKSDLKWLKYIIYSIVALLSFVLISRLATYQFADHFNFEIISFVGLAFWIFSLGYYGLKKVPVFNSIADRN